MTPPGLTDLRHLVAGLVRSHLRRGAGFERHSPILSISVLICFTMPKDRGRLQEFGKIRQNGVQCEGTDIVPYVRSAGVFTHVRIEDNANSLEADEIASFYTQYSHVLDPLSNCVDVPKGLVVEPLASGDMVLRKPDRNEAEFDLIAMVVGKCLEAPHRFAKFV